MNREVVAVIEIGSSAIRMTIAEIFEGKYKILEELRQTVRIGKDIFIRGQISRETINEAVQILKKYKKLIDEYRVVKIRSVATSAVRDSSNIDIFLDNIRTFTGIDVEILSPTKRSEFIFRALTKTLETEEKTGKEEYQGIIDVNTGQVEITVFDTNCIIFSRSLPLSALKIKQIFNKKYQTEENFINYLKVMIEHEFMNLKKDIPILKINKLYGIGPELENLSLTLNKTDIKLPHINKKELERICSKMYNYSQEEIIHKLKVPHDLAETFYPINMMFLKIMDFFECDSIYIPKVSMRDGIMQDMVGVVDEKLFFNKLEIQLKNNAINIGRSLNFDEKHAIKVMEMALKIFDQTKEIHHLGNMERAYLLVAAVLHDIGSSISYRLHHKHSLYIIRAKEFFYIDETDKNIIANIARYHRRSMPKTTHPDYMVLSHKNKMIVMKLAAILRLADGLDNTHLQLVENVELRIENNIIQVKAIVVSELLAEAYAFDAKKELFEDFFGFELHLEIEKKIYGNK